MIPFYVNVVVHALYIPFMLFVLPESLSTEARVILSKNAELSREQAKRRDLAEREWEDEVLAHEPEEPLVAPSRSAGAISRWADLVSHAGHSRRRKRAVGNARRFLRRIFGFLQPLGIFLPRDRDDGPGRDWTMTFLGCAMFCYSLMMVGTERHGLGGMGSPALMVASRE